MNELIKINSFNYGDVPTVSGRELHEALEVKTPYTMWFERMCEYGFTENEDYILVSQICETNNPKNPRTTIIDHHLTIDTAKEICMLQRTDIGRTIRKYFIETEKQYRQQLSTTALLQHIQSLESRIATLESKQTKTRKALTLPEEEPTDEIKLVLNFIDECCMKRINGYNKDGITTRVLYDYFVKWCYQEKNVTPPTKTDFVKGVCNFFDVSYKNKNKIRRKTNEQRYYIITLRPEYINK
ncbi:MAG: antA/AntB antirepressor family protein [Ruminococcus sp.]|nr:antA/AntB antirepressor family protein [Ruminococcus sp.]